MLKNNFGTHSPGILIAPADLALGKRWKTAFQTKKPDGVLETSFWEYHAKAYETITVPQGIFKALYVVGSGQARWPNGVTYLEAKSWFDPVSLRRLRHESTFRNYGKIVHFQIIDLVSFKQGAG